jgi:hypothetical protein
MKFEFEPNEIAEFIREALVFSIDVKQEEVVEPVLLDIALRISRFLASHAADNFCTFDKFSFLKACKVHITTPAIQFQFEPTELAEFIKKGLKSCPDENREEVKSVLVTIAEEIGHFLTTHVVDNFHVVDELAFVEACGTHSAADE